MGLDDVTACDEAAPVAAHLVITESRLCDLVRLWEGDSASNNPVIDIFLTPVDVVLPGLVNPFNSCGRALAVLMACVKKQAAVLGTHPVERVDLLGAGRIGKGSVFLSNES